MVAPSEGESVTGLATLEEVLFTLLKKAVLHESN